MKMGADKLLVLTLPFCYSDTKRRKYRMPFDGLTATCMAGDLQSLIGAKVERVHQPHRDMIIINLRGYQGNIRLLISSNAVNARLHITKATFENPAQPPLFCMVMRKHLEGTRIKELRQTQMERSFCFVFAGVDELGRPTEKHLYVEIMGKHSNIVLTTPEGLILDGIKRFTHQISRHREILPGELYIEPPSQEKLNLCAISQEQFTQSLFEALSAKKLVNTFSDLFLGISAQAAKELLARANLQEDMRGEEAGSYELNRIWQAWEEISPMHRQQPCVLKIANIEKDFFPYKPSSQGELVFFDTTNEAVDAFYSAKEKRERFNNIKLELSRVVLNFLDKANKKLSLQNEDFIKAEDASRFRIYGEILTANLWKLPERAHEVTLENFYDGKEITIPLDKKLLASVNAQVYFKKYNKAKLTINYLTAQIEGTKQEIAYLEEVETAIDLAQTSEDVAEIRQELENEKYLKPKLTKGKKKQIQKPSEPLVFDSPEGFKIYVGKNSLQNDRLTLKIAKANDIWLHTKNIPGSHVVIKSEGKTIPSETIYFAAEIAARHSKAKDGNQVPVDYTDIKNVHKPNGAKPGYVIYEKQKTVYVTP